MEVKLNNRGNAWFLFTAPILLQLGWVAGKQLLYFLTWLAA